MAKTTKKDDKVMDVAKPGASAPDASSRPVIVGHRTILQDPMVTPVQKDEGKEEPIVSTTAPTLKPLTDNAHSLEDIKNKKELAKSSKPAEKAAAEEPTKEESKPAAVIEVTEPDTKEPEPKESKEPEEQKETEKPADSPEPEEKPAEEERVTEPDTQPESDEAATDAVAEQAAKKTTSKEEQETAARQETVQKLITDKTYNLPIGEAKRKRNMSLGVLLLLLLVAGAVAYLLIDAEIIKTSIKLPFEFFK